jgi:lantibiotic modifying enzyme
MDDIWNAIASTRFRQVIRTTLYYMYVMRRAQMPDNSRSDKAALRFITESLEDEARVAAYEAYELSNAIVPIFHHYPDSGDVYDGYGRVYSRFFGEGAIEEVRSRWANMSDDYLQRSIEVIRLNLSTVLEVSPESKGL